MAQSSFNAPVELCPYNPDWPQAFQVEANNLKLIFGSNLVEIHHIGSTAIPRLLAKPLIDMMPVVKNINKVEQIHAEMKDLGYTAMGELGIPGRRFFYKGQDTRLHNVHVFQEGDPHVVRHLKFRDILRERPDLRAEYGELKLHLAKQHRLNRKAYTDGKAEFIRKVEEREGTPS